jgi:hypothetical protein
MVKVMSPRTKAPSAEKKPQAPLVRPALEDVDALNEALDEADAGRGTRMTAEEAERAVATGRWPGSSA